MLFKRIRDTLNKWLKGGSSRQLGNTTLLKKSGNNNTPATGAGRSDSAKKGNSGW